MIPHPVMESQTTLDGTSLSVARYRCMVPAMSGLLRSARPCVVALLAAALVVGINGFEGAIHSVHHPLVPVESHGHDGHGHDGEGRQAPAGATDEGCPVAAAALHLAATTTEAPPVLGALPHTAARLPPSVRSQANPPLRQASSGRRPPRCLGAAAAFPSDAGGFR